MSAKKQARSARAARAAELRREAERQERRRRLVAAGVIALVVVGIVVGTVIAVTSSQDDVTTAPSGATDDYGYLVGDESAEPVAVVVYEDFQCPVCAQFEATTGQSLREQADGGDITLEYRIVSFLDRASSTDYSTRSANAAACVVDEGGISALLPFHDQLFETQPPEGGEGLPDDQLAGYAEDADAAGAAECITNGTFEPWVGAATDAASQADVTGTPTIWVDGERVGAEGTVPEAEEIQAAIDAAGS